MGANRKRLAMQQESEEARVKRLKGEVAATVDSRQKELTDMSLGIHRNPELLFNEFKASKLLVGYLRDNGFSVEYPAYGLETAFKATLGDSRPRVGIMAEYDALPEIGHGCGHNIIGTAAVGAGVALASIIKEIGGTVVIFGTPAEEGGNGKELMAKQGAFNDIDAGMMIHPFNGDFLYNNTLTVSDLINIEYFGKEAHASTPEKGINALDALLIGFSAFKTMQPLLPSKMNTCIISNGGTFIAIVPGHTQAQLLLPARNDEELKDALAKVENCFKAGAIATGARLEFRHNWENRYRATHTNRVIAECFDANMKTIRKKWNPPNSFSGSELAPTDMGSVSQITPSIHAFIAIAPTDVAWHTVESTAACASEEGRKAMLDSAKAMAMTTIDLIMEPGILRRADEEFKKTLNSMKRNHA
jgi:amidohydrolase